MKRARIGMIATAVLAVATMAFAQAKPDFSGTWTPDAAAAPARRLAAAAPVAARRVAAAVAAAAAWRPDDGQADRRHAHHRADQGRQQRQPTTYKLDGTESKNAGRGPGDGQGHREVGRQQARHHDRRPSRASQAQTWSLEGGKLTIERTGGRGPAKTTYKKTT